MHYLQDFLYSLEQRDTNYFYTLLWMQIPSRRQSGHIPLRCQGEWDVVLKGCDYSCEKESQNLVRIHTYLLLRKTRSVLLSNTWHPIFKLIWMCKTNNVECQTALQKLKLQSVQFQAGAHPAPVYQVPRSHGPALLEAAAKQPRSSGGCAPSVMQAWLRGRGGAGKPSWVVSTTASRPGSELLQHPLSCSLLLPSPLRTSLLTQRSAPSQLKSFPRPPSCDGSLYVSTWLGSGMPRELVNSILGCVHEGVLRRD